MMENGQHRVISHQKDHNARQIDQLWRCLDGRSVVTSHLGRLMMSSQLKKGRSLFQSNSNWTNNVLLYFLADDRLTIRGRFIGKDAQPGGGRVDFAQTMTIAMTNAMTM